VRFLIGAQLPHRLAAAIIAAGHDARHTRELPSGNATSDEDIMTIADHVGFSMFGSAT
jgi:predicted nuclease of predicted toxin-antitoxin system